MEPAPSSLDGSPGPSSSSSQVEPPPLPAAQEERRDEVESPPPEPEPEPATRAPQATPALAAPAEPDAPPAASASSTPAPAPVTPPPGFEVPAEEEVLPIVEPTPPTSPEVKRPSAPAPPPPLNLPVSPAPAFAAAASSSFSTPVPAAARPEGAATIHAWLDEIGLAEEEIVERLASVAPDLECLSLMSEAALTNALSPLKMRGIKLRKLQAAFSTLRSPSAIDYAIAADAAPEPVAPAAHGTAATQPQFTPRFTSMGAPQVSHRSSPSALSSSPGSGSLPAVPSPLNPNGKGSKGRKSSGATGVTGQAAAPTAESMVAIGEDGMVSVDDPAAFLASTAASALALNASLEAKAKGDGASDAPQFSARALAASADAGGDAAPLFTPRTLAALANGSDDFVGGGGGDAAPEMTPRTVAATLGDEALARELQSQQDEDAALEEALRLSAAEAAQSSSPSPEAEAKKKGKKGAAAKAPKAKGKGRLSAAAAALSGGGGGGKGSAHFAVDVDDCGGRAERAIIELGARHTETVLNKKWLSKPIRQGLVVPFLSQLAPHLASVGVSISPDDVIISVEGAQVDGMEAASFFVSRGHGTAAEPIHVLLTFPYLPSASAVLADPSLASWPGAYPATPNASPPHGGGGGSRSLPAISPSGTSPGGASPGGGQYHAHPNKIESARFHVDISTANREDVIPTETVLQKKWLNKPLKAGLVLPALKAYMSGQWQADLSKLQLTILVDGLEVDGAAPGSAYVRMDGVITTVAIILPPDALAPGAKAQMTFNVYIDDTGWTTPSETTLNKKWMMRPLLQALVEPALKHHCKNMGVAPVPLHEISIQVDGQPTDGSPPAYTFLQMEGRPVRVDLSLPSRSYTIRRISRR